MAHRLGRSGLGTEPDDAIVMYHSVGDPGKYGNVSVDRLRRDVEYFTEQYAVVDLPDVLDEETDSKRIALTFDDAFGNFYRNALPILRKYDLPATLFVTTAFVDGADEERIRECHMLDDVGPDTMMSEAELQEVAREDSITIGNHTMTHPDLSELTDDRDRRREILGAKRDLERRFDVDVSRFCYPHGDVDRRSKDLVRESHELAVTSRPGLVACDADPHVLPRLHGHRPASFLRWDVTDLKWILTA